MTTTTIAADDGKRWMGTVKRVLTDKGYGFLQYGDKSQRDVFFHFNDLPPQQQGAVVEAGDELSFVNGQNKGKPLAKEIQWVNPPSSTDNQVTIRAFSMNQPFAALLANGYKDLETRNGTMFVPYAPGPNSYSKLFNVCIPMVTVTWKL